MHPVVAVYATFMNRAYDQVLMDVALHKAPVTFVLDRAGVTGDDGASHNGMWDLSIFQTVPGLQIAAPRDGTRLRELFAEAIAVDDGPTMLRYPKGALPQDIEAIDQVGRADVLHRSGAQDVLIVAVGAMAGCALEVAERLGDQGIGVTVVDPRWVLPVSARSRGPRRRASASSSRWRTTSGSAASVPPSPRRCRTPRLRHRCTSSGCRAASSSTRRGPQVMAAEGLTAQDVARGVVERVSGLSPLALPGGRASRQDADLLDERRSS